MAGLLAIIIFVLVLASSVFFALIIGLKIKGSILNILFSYLFFRHRVLKFIDLFLSRQEFVSFSLSVLKFGVVLGGGGGSNNEKDAGGGG